MAKGFFLAGHAANACRNAIGVTVSSEDPKFLKANLQDGYLYSPFKFDNPAETNPSIAFDNNVVDNGTYEADAAGVSPPSFWRTLSGSPDVSTDQFNDGAKSLRLNLANEAAFQDRLVAPATTHRISSALRGDGSANAVNGYLINMDTMQYLTNAPAWTTTKTAWATKTAAAWETFALTYTLPAPPYGWVGPTRLRLLYERPGTVTGAAYVDSVAMWPKITCAALLIHAIPNSFPIAIESADDSAFSTNLNDHGDLPAWAWKSYLTFAGPATPQRHWRYAVTGALLAQRLPTWVTQPVMGERKEFLRSPRFGIVMARRMPKGGTEDQPSSQALVPRHRFEMDWGTNASALQQVADEMVGGSRHGDEPVLAVPEIGRPEFVYGRGEGLAEISVTRRSSSKYLYSLSFEDDRSFVDTM